MPITPLTSSSYSGYNLAIIEMSSLHFPAHSMHTQAANQTPLLRRNRRRAPHHDFRVRALRREGGRLAPRGGHLAHCEGVAGDDA